MERVGHRRAHRRGEGATGLRGAEGRPWGRERIFKLRAEGVSLRRIAMAMKVPLATGARAARSPAMAASAIP